MKRFTNKGFTLIEFLVSVAVFAGMLGLLSVNLLSTQHKVNLTAAIDTLMTDLRLQQFKAMAGDTEGRGVNDTYGVYLGTTSYTVFHGGVYNPGDSANFVVNLPMGITLINVTWPGQKIVFAKGSGEVAAWSAGTNSLQLTAISDGKHKTVTINRYGVVDTVN